MNTGPIYTYRSSAFGALLKCATATLLAVGVFASGTNMTEAASIFSLSVEYTSGTSVTPGGKVTLVAEMPVAQQGTVTQEIVQTIDPTKLRLTAASDITYPNGWTLSVSFDGNSFTTTLPATATGSATSWDKVVKVKAAGPIVSQGESNGYQIAEGSATGSPTTATPPSTALVTAGDPYYSFFDAKRSMVFYIAHHTSGNILGCVVISTNTACNGAPYSIAGVGSDGYAVGKVINNRIWFPGSNGFGGLDGLACLDISTLVANPQTGTPVNCGVFPEFNSIITNLVGGRASQSEQEIWGFQWTTSKFICFDTALRASCGSIQTAAPLARRYYSYIFQQWGDRLYVQTDANAGTSGLYCYSISSATPCSGFPKSKGRMYNMFVMPNAQGQGVALCYLDSGNVCWDANGNAYSPSTAQTDLIPWTSSFSSTSGTRVISASGSTYRCWDAAANGGAGGWCYAYSSYSGLNYTVTQDPLLPECIWISADNGSTVSTRDMSTNTSGCGNASKKILTLAGTTAVPRMACGTTGGGSIREWRELDLITPAPTTYSSVTLSVASTQGVDIPGWQGIAVTSWPRNISTLDPTVTGSSPQFQLTFTNLDNSVSTATVEITAVGDAPQLCLTPQSTLTCPSVGTGLGFVSGLPTATTSSATSSGTATDGSSNVTNVGPSTQTVTLGAPGPDQCGGQIRGTASTTGTSTNVTGVTVNLLDSNGSIVRDASNNPITTTTDAGGNYSFGNLKPGNYKVSFGANNGTNATATQYTNDGTGATGTNTATATSNTVAVATTQTDVVNATYPAPLTAVNDTSIGAQGAAQTKDLTTNDFPATGNTLTKSSVYLCDDGQSDAACKTAAARTKTVSGVGSYSVNATTGVMTFTPEPTYVGTPPALKYVISDSGNSTTSATYTPTVAGAPTAVADTTDGDYGATQSKNLLLNDTTDPAVTFDTASVRLCDTGETAPACTKTSLSRPEGVYSLTNGTITFAPASGYSGTPQTPVPYSVTDSAGQQAHSTYTPTVAPLAPPAGVADTTSGFAGMIQSIDPMANDTLGGSPNVVSFVTSSVKLCDAGQTPPNCNATNLTNTAGTYQVNVNTGAITFTPASRFSGVAPAVTYQVTDTLGGVGSSTYVATVIAPVAASPDTSTGLFAATQTTDLLLNDTVDPSASFDSSSVRLCDAGETAPSCTKTTVARPEGTYSLTGGTITFTPAEGYSGTPATPVAYSVTDSLGQRTHSTYTPTVTPPAAPTATPERKAVTIGGTVAFTTTTGTNGLATGTGLKTGTSGGASFVCPVTRATTCSATQVVIANEGTWSMDQTTGIATFTAASSVTTSGDLTPVTYRVTDAAGQTATATLTPVITPPPSASNDTSTGEQGKEQTVSLVGNDAVGNTITGFDPTTVKLCAPGTTAPCSLTTVIVPGEGTYRINPNGTLTFTPDKDFVGTATPLTYTVVDTLGQPATATLTITVAPPPFPAAQPDTANGAYGQDIVFSPWLNDSPGTPPTGSTRPAPQLVPTSIRLCGPGQNAPTCDATTLTTPDGTYSVDTKTGKVTFTPAAGFTGTATQPVTYQIANNWTGANGIGVTTSILIPTTQAPDAPVAVDDTATTNGKPVAIDPLTNDTATTSPLDPTTLRLCDANETAPTCTRTSVTTTQGTFSVDTTTGKVTFRPNKNFTGPATITYVIADRTGKTTFATIRITSPDSNDQITAAGTPTRPKGDTIVVTGINAFSLISIIAIGLLLAGAATINVKRLPERR